MKETDRSPGDSAEAYSVLFDGGCPLCRAAASRLETADREGNLEFLSSRSPEVAVRFPELSKEALDESIHLVSSSGEVWVGELAIEKIVSRLPGWRWAAWVFRLPLGRKVARKAYRWVASNRLRLTCRDHCGSG